MKLDQAMFELNAFQPAASSAVTDWGGGGGGGGKLWLIFYQCPVAVVPCIKYKENSVAFAR